MSTASAAASRPAVRTRKNATPVKKQTSGTAAGAVRKPLLPIHQPKAVKDAAAHRRKLAARKQPGAHVPLSDVE